MRIYFTLFCCCYFGAMLSQNAFFVTKKGDKVIVRDDALEVITIDNRVSYKLVGKTWEKYVTFKELDYLISGPIFFKTFNLNKKKRDQGFFVLAETDNKKLISLVTEVTTTSGSGYVSSRTHYLVIVIDDNEMILEQTSFTSSSFYESKQYEAVAIIRNHFSNCAPLMQRLSEVEGDNNNLLAFFDAPIYNKCQ